MTRTADDSAPNGTRPSASIRVLVADDQAPLRRAICDLVANDPAMAAVGAAADADEAVELARETTPDVALLDVKMPGGGALAATRILAVSPQTKILALSAYSDRGSVLDMLRAGAATWPIRARGPWASGFPWQAGERTGASSRSTYP